jgi:IclR family acetate operon transcriptional repressor
MLIFSNVLIFETPAQNRVTWPTMATQQPAQAPDSPLGRTFRIIEGIVAADESLGPRELARRVGIDRSTVGRTLVRLSEMQILVRDADGYRPGPRLMALSRALAIRDSLPNAAMPILRELSVRYDETTYLCLRQGPHGVFIYDIPTTNPVRYVLELGRPFPLYIGASGRAILSGLEPDDVEDVLSSLTLEPVTGRTVTDRARLLQMIKADRATGYSASVSERVDGGSAVAAPFFDGDGVCRGAITLTCPISRLDRSRVPEMGDAVSAAAQALSLALGHRESTPVVTE